jgi:hypothetical protein
MRRVLQCIVSHNAVFFDDRDGGNFNSDLMGGTD